MKKRITFKSFKDLFQYLDHYTKENWIAYYTNTIEDYESNELLPPPLVTFDSTDSTEISRLEKIFTTVYPNVPLHKLVTMIAPAILSIFSPDHSNRFLINETSKNNRTTKSKLGRKLNPLINSASNFSESLIQFLGDPASMALIKESEQLTPQNITRLTIETGNFISTLKNIQRASLNTKKDNGIIKPNPRMSRIKNGIASINNYLNSIYLGTTKNQSSVDWLYIDSKAFSEIDPRAKQQIIQKENFVAHTTLQIVKFLELDHYSPKHDSYSISSIKGINLKFPMIDSPIFFHQKDLKNIFLFSIWNTEYGSTKTINDILTSSINDCFSDRRSLPESIHSYRLKFYLSLYEYVTLPKVKSKKASSVKTKSLKELPFTTYTFNKPLHYLIELNIAKLMSIHKSN